MKTIKKQDLNNSHLDDMSHGDEIFIPESDYGFGSIYKVNSDYEFWAIPMYGGEPQFEIRFNVGNDGARKMADYVCNLI